MVHVQLLAAPLRDRVGGRTDLEVPWAGEGSVSQFLTHLFDRFPELRSEVMDRAGGVQVDYQLWLNGDMVRDREETERRVKDGDTLAFLLPMSGGA